MEVKEPLELRGRERKLSNSSLDCVTETWDDLKRKTEHIKTDYKSMDLVAQKKSKMVSVTALRRPETHDLILLEKGQSAFFCFIAFQTNQLQVSFYTVLMHYFQCFTFYMWEFRIFLSVIFYARY